MSERLEVLQLRYTLPGLGYFFVTYTLLFILKPTTLDLSAQNTWVALGAIAVAGSVPVGYLIHQGYQLWNYWNGRIEHWDHIKKLKDYIQSTNSADISLKIDGEQFILEKKELLDELKRMGTEYILRTGVRRHKKEIEENGYLTPLHDLFFMETKAHDSTYHGAWTYARVTRSFVGALLLAFLPWVPSIFGPMNITIAGSIFFAEFLVLIICSLLVSKYSYNQADIDEGFLTWVYWKAGKLGYKQTEE